MRSAFFTLITLALRDLRYLASHSYRQVMHGPLKHSLSIRRDDHSRVACLLFLVVSLLSGSVIWDSIEWLQHSLRLIALVITCPPLLVVAFLSTSDLWDR